MTGIETAAVPTLIKLAADLLRAIQARLRRGADRKLVSAAVRELLSPSPDIAKAEASLSDVTSKSSDLFKAREMLKRAKKAARQKTGGSGPRKEPGRRRPRSKRK